MWDLKTGIVQFVIQGHKNTGMQLSHQASAFSFNVPFSVTTVDLAKDGRLLASGSGDCEVRLCKCELSYRVRWTSDIAPTIRELLDYLRMSEKASL
jgi:glucose repression regulatory protein TUP1